MSNQEQEYTLSNQNLKASVKCLHPRVGLGVFVTREGRFLIGKRKGFHGSGTWQLPGGNLEFGESFQDCASREVLEETNLIIHNIRYHTTTNDPMPELNSHYVDIFMCAESADINAEPIVMEPDKCDIWNWITWDEFIKDGIDSQTNKYRPMFQPMQSYILQRNVLKGKEYEPPSKYAAHFYRKNLNSTLNYLDSTTRKNAMQQRSLQDFDTSKLFELAQASNQAYCMSGLDLIANQILGTEYIVAFGGFSLTKKEWTNLKFKMVPYVVDGLNPDPLIQVAEIFQNGFLALKKSIYSNLKFLFTIRKKEGLKIIHFTGWGIGGALAVIAAITFQLESYIKNSNFDVRVTTFGAPRIGNTYFARLINKFLDIQRFTYFNDHVPHFPKRDSIPNDILTHHELELWIIPEKLCDCPTEFRIVRCPGFDYKKKAPRQIGVSNDTFFPHRVMSGENQECNAGQSITNVRVDFVHVGPYFGKIMNDCTGVLGSR